MFLDDRPIESSEEDVLGRTPFAQRLGQSILEWQESESLVIGLYGTWGSGKSSILNMTEEYLQKVELPARPTVLRFNPWSHSGKSNIEERFFHEVSTALEVRDEEKSDRKIAAQLRLYVKLLNLVPDETALGEIVSKVILAMGVFGVVGGTVTFNDMPVLKSFLAAGGVILLLLSFSRVFVGKISSFFESRAELRSLTASSLKTQIHDKLNDREKKLVIFIDDVDRLTQAEIRQIFRLVRVNADFPNTVYVFAFDRKVVAANLEEQVGISGQEYLEKIVQVSFEVSDIPPAKVAVFLFEELDQVLASLPETSNKLFNQTHWANVYHSGYKDFFVSLRQVKRYVSSLNFNFSLMHRQGSMEVNPIDFMAIEAIRVFAPSFYSFMRSNKPLFTSTERTHSSRPTDDSRKLRIEEALGGLTDDFREPIRQLLKRLFPQVEGVYQFGYSTYGPEWNRTWSKELRLCSTEHFERYFLLSAEPNTGEVGQYELDRLLEVLEDSDLLREELQRHIAKETIRSVLERLQNFTDDPASIPEEQIENLVVALFDISDELPTEPRGVFDIGADMDIMRIVTQLLKRTNDSKKNCEVLSSAIRRTRGFLGPIRKVGIEGQRAEKETAESLVDENCLKTLQELCARKLETASDSVLRKHHSLLLLLYRWRDWAPQSLTEFVEKQQAEDSLLLEFVEGFIGKSMSQGMGEHGFKVTKAFNYKALADFLNLEEAKVRLETIKREKPALYRLHNESVDMFLKNYHKREQVDPFDDD